jgi:hypothetical protein
MNQDYKTAHRRAQRNLQLVETLSNEYQSTEGLTREEAVEKAATMVLWPVRTLTPQAAKAQGEGVGERDFVASFRLELRKAARKAYRAAKKGGVLDVC